MTSMKLSLLRGMKVTSPGNFCRFISFRIWVPTLSKSPMWWKSRFRSVTPAEQNLSVLSTRLKEQVGAPASRTTSPRCPSFSLKKSSTQRTESRPFRIGSPAIERSDWSALAKSSLREEIVCCRELSFRQY